MTGEQEGGPASVADAPGSSPTHAALAALLRTALTEPAATSTPAIDAIEATLRAPQADEPARELALAALAALLYARPGGLAERAVASLTGLARVSPPPSRLLPRLATVWGCLAATAAAADAWRALSDALADETVPPETRAGLVPLVGTFVQWREDLVDLDAVLALADAPALAEHRRILLDQAVERLVFCAPDAFTPARLARLAARFGDLPRYRHVLHALVGRAGVPPDARAIAAGQIEGAFPHRARAAAILTGRPVQLLVALNAGMGQGDDLVRLGPLLQALLDANPALTVVLLTRRRYLYDHPRLTPVAIEDDDAVGAALRGAYDGVIEFFQPEWPEFTFREEIHAAIDDRLRSRPPRLVIQGDMGRPCRERPGGRSQFLFHRVELDGRDIAEAAGLERRHHPSVYDPARRLLAELGLTERTGEESPGGPSVLTGVPSADAERVWRALVPHGSAPVALVSPFGGSWHTKGFHGQEALLAGELAGLVEEGYRLVVLVQGTKWAGRPALEPVLARLPENVRARITVSPDPVDPDAGARLALVERPELSTADRVMRLFKYFASYADLVVTVEGWLAHLAYQLGRPFRVFLAAGSYDLGWLPHGRSPRQRLVPALSPGGMTGHAGPGLPGPGEPPPFPHRPRKALLGVALAGLGAVEDPDAGPPLRRALASPDPDVRGWALAALGRIGPPAAHKSELLAALADRAPRVAAAAAEALLRRDADCARELGANYRLILQAYVDAAAQKWDAVARLGPAAAPVLFWAARSEVHDVGRGAKQALRRLLSPYVPELREDPSPDGPKAG